MYRLTNTTKSETLNVILPSGDKARSIAPGGTLDVPALTKAINALITKGVLSSVVIADESSIGENEALASTYSNASVKLIGRTVSSSSTLIIDDLNQLVITNSASPITLTIPNDSAVAFPIGAVINTFQRGTGQASFVAGGGVTLRQPSSFVPSVQYATISVRKIAANEWAIQQ